MNPFFKSLGCCTSQSNLGIGKPPDYVHVSTDRTVARLGIVHLDIALVRFAEIQINREDLIIFVGGYRVGKCSVGNIGVRAARCITFLKFQRVGRTARTDPDIYGPNMKFDAQVRPLRCINITTPPVREPKTGPRPIDRFMQPPLSTPQSPRHRSYCRHRAR